MTEYAVTMAAFAARAGWRWSALRWT